MLLKDKKILDDLIEKLKKVEAPETKLYELGKKVEALCPQLIKLKPNGNKQFKYLEWQAYEHVLESIDPDHFWWISHADKYRVEITMTWFGKEYKGSYGVKEPAKNKTTGEYVKSISNQTVDDGMRCYAKLASRKTKFMKHLWLENGNQ